MRIIDGLMYQLRIRDFIQLDLRMKGVNLFYRQMNQAADLVILFHAPGGDELPVQDYDRALENIKMKFLANGFQGVNLLSLILTNEPDRAKQYCLDEGEHWIIDLSGRRLMIYENQASDYSGLRKDLEDLLEKEEVSMDMELPPYPEDSQSDYGGRGLSRGKNGWVTPLNTALIVLNILVHLLVYYTGILGSSKKILALGSLNWYQVFKEGEYYRILTSMFLHSNLSHLFNNMLIAFFVGDNLERAIGKFKYLLIYFGTGMIAGITSISYNMLKEDYVYSIGASGAIFGIVGAMAYIIIANKGRLEDLSVRQIILFAAVSLYGGLAGSEIDNAAHIGGFLGGILLALLLYRKKKTIDAAP
jgi:rhomboid protease GluP